MALLRNFHMQLTCECSDIFFICKMISKYIFGQRLIVGTSLNPVSVRVPQSIFWSKNKKVKAGNDQEMTRSERNSH